MLYTHILRTSQLVIPARRKTYKWHGQLAKITTSPQRTQQLNSCAAKTRSHKDHTSTSTLTKVNATTIDSSALPCTPMTSFAAHFKTILLRDLQTSTRVHTLSFDGAHASLNGI